ncbi:MAG: transcriptional repressor NrdR [Clostridia bacterium]|nr:transcriptional repressor NrdR [Clostridia bacterium]
MKCPFCAYDESKVIDSRPADDGNRIRRRRECIKCGKRFTTFEAIETIPLVVIKKDNTREPFSREKILRGLMKACEKRPISVDMIEGIVTDIENVLCNSLEKEITTTYIGDLVMERLKKMDDVAYVRYASVHRQFKDINSLFEEVSKLLKEGND